MLTRCNLLDSLFRPGLARRAVAAAMLLGTLHSGAVAQGVGELDAFFRSVTDGRVEIVKQGLRKNPDWANAELFLGIRPVYRASVLGREQVVVALLAAGADVNATTDRGTHSLHAAAQHGYGKILDSLLAAGATVDAADSAGQTPLHFAIRFGHDDLARRLLSQGASVNVGDLASRTPLHYAAGLGQIDSVRLLLENGADIDAVDAEGFTPLGLALTWKRNEFEPVSQYLTNRGGVDLRPESARMAPETPAAPGAGAEPEPKPEPEGGDVPDRNSSADDERPAEDARRSPR